MKEFVHKNKWLTTGSAAFLSDAIVRSLLSWNLIIYHATMTGSERMQDCQPSKCDVCMSLPLANLTLVNRWMRNWSLYLFVLIHWRGRNRRQNSDLQPWVHEKFKQTLRDFFENKQDLLVFATFRDFPRTNKPPSLNWTALLGSKNHHVDKYASLLTLGAVFGATLGLSCETVPVRCYSTGIEKTRSLRHVQSANTLSSLQFSFI